MRDDHVCYRRVDRSQLPALLQGVEPDGHARLRDIAYTVSATDMVAVWNSSDDGYRGFLPDLLIAEEPILLDSLAWSNAFLQGVGPLSRLLRIVSPAELRAVTDGIWNMPVLSTELVGAMTALVVGECFARLGKLAVEDRVSLSTASNTLSFALFRAMIVAPYLELDEIVRRWNSVQPELSNQRQSRITDLVVELSRDIVRDSPLRGWADRARYQHGLKLELDMFDDGSSRLRRRLAELIPSLLPDAFWDDDSSLSAEAIVRLADDVVPTLSRVPDLDQSEKAQIIVRLACKANPDIGNQIELVRSSLDLLPEIGLWLGRFLGNQAPGKIFSFNDGTGWLVAKRLSSVVDILSPPTADISWLEVNYLSIAHSRMPSRREHRTIEIFPGCVIERSLARPQGRGSADPRDKAGYRRTREVDADEMMDRMAKNLEEALVSIRHLQKDQRARR